MERDGVTLPPSQQEPSQGELVAEEDPDPPVSGSGCRARAVGRGECARARGAGCALAVPAACVRGCAPPCGRRGQEERGRVPPRERGLCHLSPQCLLAGGEVGVWDGGSLSRRRDAGDA